MSNMTLDTPLATVTHQVRLIAENIEKVILGKREVVDLTLVALLCGSHVLLEDVPGVGKTMLAKSLAASLGCHYKRLQFTPDLLPSDITGVSIFNQQTGEFRFVEGPVFTNVLLADEINRASPKTQAALLECMEERQVTIDGQTRVLPGFFFVLATQNPIEYEGTYPLPESQLDRFILRLNLGYPAREQERLVIEAQTHGNPLALLKPVIGLDDVVAMQAAVRTVHVSESAREYLLDLIIATREHQDLYLGASPRGSIALYRAAQALAVISGQEYVLPDHVKRLAPKVLGHRLIIKPEARIAGVSPEDVIADIIKTVPIDVA